MENTTQQDSDLINQTRIDFETPRDVAKINNITRTYLNNRVFLIKVALSGTQKQLNNITFMLSLSFSLYVIF